MRRVRVAVTALGVLGTVLLLAGCGTLAGTSPHRPSPQTSVASSSRHPSRHPPALAAKLVGWRHLNLPAAMAIRGILGGSGRDVTLVLRRSPTTTDPAGLWATASYNWATGALGSVTTVAEEPSISVATTYQLARGTAGGPVITNGKTVVLAWPASIPTYTSGQNPAANQFGVDNAVVGQTGRWLWAALKGPQAPPSGIPAGVWGYRRWDRLVALNLDTRRYAVYPIPMDGSEALYGPLWEHPPVFRTLPSGDGLVALGHWAAVVPADPAGVTSLRVLGSGSTTEPSVALERQAALVVNQQAWDSINADAAFWNCYVMADPSTAACPHGASVFGGTALSMQTVYMNSPAT
jgi:hypothetical protein